MYKRPGSATRAARAARTALVLLAAGAAFTVTPAPAAGQGDLQGQLRASQLRLDSIRAEGSRLQAELGRLRTRVRDANRELTNIAEQRAASTAALQELTHQSELLLENIHFNTSELDHTSERLQARSAALQQRLRAIYKRGPLHPVRVLLSASDFGDLFNRYRYMRAIALHERAMVAEVGRLQATLADRQAELEQSADRLEQVRAQAADEVLRLERLESQWASTVRDTERQQSSAVSRLQQLERDERELGTLIATLERRRQEEEARRAGAGDAAPAGALSTRDRASLAWPVEGNVLSRFGAQRNPDGIVLRNNGIGIAAAAGTPVRTVGAGTVEYARRLEGWGNAVIVGHGDGYFTGYFLLREIQVAEGDRVAARQVVGTVGGEATQQGPHLEFRVWEPSADGGILYVDPLSWLQRRAGG
ncbi:MAG: peptidoglycan DD-metalloendopeptidase family protein [Gemmatimonadota bacterium]